MSDVAATPGPVPRESERPAAGPSIPAGRAANAWIWIIVALLVILLLGWILISALPFGSDSEIERSVIEPQRVEESVAPPAPLESIAVDDPAEAIVIDEIDEPLAPASDADGAPSGGGMTPGQADAILIRWIRSSDHYDVPSSCVAVRNLGFENRGYTIELFASNCPGRSDGLLGRWRVDTETSRVYEQKSDGRYLAP